MNTGVNFQMLCGDCGSLGIKIEKSRTRLARSCRLLRRLRRSKRDRGCVERPGRSNGNAYCVAY